VKGERGNKNWWRTMLESNEVMSSNNESINLNVELSLPNSKARIPSFIENYSNLCWLKSQQSALLCHEHEK